MKKPRWLLASGFALVRIVAAMITSDTTYHLAPIIVAAAPAIRDRRDRLRWALLGFGLASAVAVTLALAGRMSGPSLLPVGGALFESIMAAALGALAGGLLAGRTAPRVARSAKIA